MCGLVAGLLVASGVGVDSRAAGDAEPPKTHRDEIEAWITWREARLTRPDGYLSIVGLYPLEDGASTFGSDSTNDVVFPPGAPGRIGTFDLRNGEVTVTIEPTVDVVSDSARVTTLALRDDADETRAPTLLQMGTLSWYVIRRGEARLIRLKDSQSALIKAFHGIERYPIDERWRFNARLERYFPDKYIPITNTIDVTVNERVYGAVVFDLDGQTYRLDALGTADAEDLFIIFADETSGLETYGGGRFVYVDPPGEDGKVVLDFNKAYNPPCVFNKYTTCPLPPRQNVLPIAVRAGEKTGEALH
jgi:uncharacterized protein (DUF1684 family)